MASGLSKKSEETQINTLIYSMGDQADDVLRSFQLSDEEARSYTEGKYDSHFIKKRNVIFERARFNMRRQQEGEPVDAFIMSLYTLAEHCNFGTLHDELIRDHIVVGISNTSLSLKLQLESDLTLERPVTLARQAEAVKAQQPLLRGGSGAAAETPVGAVRRDKKPKGRQNSGATPMTVPENKAGSRCGKILPIRGSIALPRTQHIGSVGRKAISKPLHWLSKLYTGCHG